MPAASARPAPAAGGNGPARGARAPMSTEDLRDRLLAGDRRALARAITMVESTRPDHRGNALALLEGIMPATGRSVRIGISGVPGVGKSTFIEALGLYLIEQGHRLAVLAVDPSSAVSGGSILGDKTRMPELARRREAFIRPSPAGRTLGGVARRTRESILLCEAAGFDVVLVETVGVGQSEMAVADMTDLFLLLLLPGGGDELQGIKRGIVELADIVVVNKADGAMREAAERARAEYTNALRLLRPRLADWEVPVRTCSALAGEGIDAVWAAIGEYRRALGDRLAARRGEQAKAWMWSEISESLVERLWAEPAARAAIEALQARVERGEMPATQAAAQVLDAIEWQPAPPG